MRPSGLIAALIALSASRIAYADCIDPVVTPLPHDPVTADRLFTEAKELLKNGAVEQACARLETSYALDPAGGTLLQLAYCLELGGKLASAYARYEAALAIARRDNNERRVSLATEHMVALAPRLTKLEIRARAGRQLDIRRDGLCLADTAVNTPVPVDPGKHSIVVVSPGKEPWHTEVDLTMEGTTTIVEVPRLVPRGAAPANPLDPPPESPGSRLPGAIVLGVGGAGLALGIVTGTMALDVASDVQSKCRNSLCAPSEQHDAARAQTLATLSNVGFGAGAIVTLIGFGLFVTRPFGSSSGAPTLTAGPGFVSLRGAM